LNKGRKKRNNLKTRSIETSARAGLTNVAIRIRIRIRIVRDPDRHQNLIVCLLAHWNFHSNPFGSSCAKLLPDKQTDRQRRLHILIGGGKKLNYFKRKRTVVTQYRLLWFTIL